MKRFIKELSGRNNLYEVAFDGELYYQIVHKKNGTAATFDHDSALVARIEAYIEAHGRALTPKKSSLIFSKSTDGTGTLALAAFLYHCYHEMPIEQVRGAAVRHLGMPCLADGSEDCRKESLVHMSGVQYKTPSREFCLVEIDGAEFVELRMRACARSVYLDNDPVLIDLLADASLFSGFHFNGKTGVQAELKTTSGGKRNLPYIHQIVCAVRMGLLTRENFSDLVNIIDRMTEDDSLQIDHLDADVFNNTYQNLSLMAKTINEAKKGYTAACFGRYSTAWAYDWTSGDYLAELITTTPDGEELRAHYRCSCSGDLLDYIKHLIGKNKMTARLTHYMAPGADGVAVVPLPNGAFAEERRQYKADGGTGTHPKIEANTVAAVESGARLIAMNESEPERFVPWTKIGCGVPATSDGISGLLRNFGVGI